jgi:gliding motility-associated-like protein
MVKHSFNYLLLLLVLLASAATAFAQPAIKATLNTPANARNLSESCGGPYELVIERDLSNVDTVFISIQDLGVALGGLDYNFPAGTFPMTLLPNQNLRVIPVTVVSDGLPEGTETLIWKISYKAGPLMKTITINSSIVDDYDVQIVSATDTIKWCRYAPLTLQATSASEIHWSPSPAFDPATGAEVTVRPFASGWYYAMVGTDTCGAIDSIYLNLAIANINDPDTVYICKAGNGITLNGQLLGLAQGFNWIPSDSTLSDTTSLTPLANPTVTTSYILQSDFGVCIAADTIVVRVDSLPTDLHLDVAPVKPYYCEGEIAALFSSSYDSLKFPDITFNWTPYDNSFLSDQDLLNAALQLLDTTTYIRESINNACSSFDSITLNVVPSGVPLSLMDTTLCPGQMFQVLVLSNQVTEPMWMPETGLSCTECLNPTVTVMGVPGTSLVYNFSGMILQCPVGASFSIQIPPSATINISASQQTVCDGDMVQLTITNPENIAGLEWKVTGGNASLDCSTCANPVVTVHGNDPVSLTVSAISTDPNFCGAFGAIQLIHGPLAGVNLTANDTIVCKGDVVSLNVLDPANFSGLHWGIVQGDVSFSCTDCLNPDITINSEDTIKLNITGMSTIQGLCGAYGEIIFIPGAQLQANQITITACKDSTTVATTGNPNIVAYHWDVLNGGVSISCSDCPSPTVTITDAGSLRYFATSNDPDVCKVTGFVNAITAPDDAAFFITDPDTSTSIGQGAQVMVMLNVTGATPTNLHWKLNGVSVGGTGITITIDANSEHNIVEATFINSFGCPQTATIDIVTDPPTYQIPNAFTPNNDMVNDKFRIITNGKILIEKFMIFNRWGQMVYKAPDNDLEGWDGNFKGKQASSDTYVYTAELRFPDGRVEVAKGDVILLR